MLSRSTIKVTPPKFELYELVTLFINDKQYNTKIVKRWLDFDDGVWWYKVSGTEKLFLADCLEPRSEIRAN